MHGCKQFLAPKHWDINQVMRDMTLGCSHKRSVLYYSNSVLIPDGFLGYRCNSYDSFLSGKCFPCPKETCPMMGHYADRFPGKTTEVHQVYYLNTEAFQPFACWREYVSVKLSGTQKMWGNIYVALIGSNEHRRQYPVANGLFSPTSTYAKIIDVSIPGNITAVEFQWKKDPAWKRTGLIGAQEVTILYGTNGHKSVFCGSQVVQPEVWQKLTLC
ncbi:pancreatic lipase-related protein 2-like [Hemicordylus capensis]|uniref:pancreatic lipase-related protein 2-like n=1 Tax=Hemicordylus capensis TaxID=884348 RepID=UPI00230234AA|nr:pancreatic lipase-related protein 2-like [Hemicordylus capensis]